MIIFLIYLIGCQVNIIETTFKTCEIKDAINEEAQEIE